MNKVKSKLYEEFCVFNHEHFIANLFNQDNLELSSNDYIYLFRSCMWHMQTNSKVHKRIPEIALEAEYLAIELSDNKAKTKSKLKEIFDEFNASTVRYENKFSGTRNNIDKPKQ